MGRPLRAATGGLVYHVLNRANARLPIFEKPADFEAFERVLIEAHQRVPMRILSYCVMPNHWHFVLWPREDRDLSDFVGWLTLTHTQRWHANRASAGSGHLYQGRFKSFPVQTDEHFLTLCRYVERNARRANLTDRAERWRWSSLWRRTNGDAVAKSLLSDWPMRCPYNWISWVNEPQTEQEVEAIRRCIQRSRPYGEERWVKRTARRLGLETTLRPRGRPKKIDKGS
jgi:REP-associated tyrosine transposase